MNPVLLITMIFGLGLIYLAIGFSRKNQAQTQEDYFVANRSLGTLPISANLVATQLGGGFILGTSATSYAHGLSGLLYPAGMVLGFLILGMGIAGKLQQCGVITTAEIFETHYRSSLLRKLASLLSIMTLFGILTAQVVGLRSLLGGFGLPDWVSGLFWLLVVTYTMVGGLRAVTQNDLIQIAIIICVFGGVFIVSLVRDYDAFLQVLEASREGLFVKSPEGVGFSFEKSVSVILVPILFSLFEQDLAQRFFAARTKRIATLSAFLSGGFLLLFAVIPVYFGMLSRVVSLGGSDGGNPLLYFFQERTHPWVFALIVCAIVAAIVSTADGLLNGISANFTQDFNWKIEDSKSALRFSRLSSLAVGCGALVFSYFVSPNVIDVLVESYELSVCALLVPLLVAYYRKKLNPLSAYLSVILGLSSYVLLKWGVSGHLQVMSALGFSGLGYALGDLISQRSQKRSQSLSDVS